MKSLKEYHSKTFKSFMLLISYQVSSPARKWADSRMYSGAVLQAEVQPAAKIPPLTLSTSGTGAETYLPAPGGEEGSKTIFL